MHAGLEDICDCHFHVFGSAERYPMVAMRGYDPPLASIADHRELFGPLGVRRMVLVQPSCYGADNSCLFDALAGLGNLGRAVIAVAPDVSDEELARMHALGGRGIRVNAVGGSTLSIAQLRAIAPRLKPLGWHVQMFLPVGRLPELADELLAADVPLVLDHFGSPDPTLDIEQPVMRALARLLDSGRCWVKMSAAFRISKAGPPYRDLLPFAQALVKMRPDRLVWGSDWPYIHFIDKLGADFNPLEFFTEAVPDPVQRQALFNGNSRELYQFG